MAATGIAECMLLHLLAVAVPAQVVHLVVACYCTCWLCYAPPPAHRQAAAKPAPSLPGSSCPRRTIPVCVSSLVPAGRITHRLLLTYKLKLEEGGKVTPTLPALNRCVGCQPPAAATLWVVQLWCVQPCCVPAVPERLGGCGDKGLAASNWRHAPQGRCAPATTCPCLLHAHVLLPGPAALCSYVYDGELEAQMYMVRWWASRELSAHASNRPAAACSQPLKWRLAPHTGMCVVPPLDWAHVLSADITGRLVCPSVCRRCLTATSSAWQVCGGAWDLA